MKIAVPRALIAAVVGEMIARRRERMTLDSLNELVGYLRTIREERKAIITISEGWLLYKENQALTTARTNSELPGGPQKQKRDL
jgi:hypothetical protein